MLIRELRSPIYYITPDSGDNRYDPPALAAAALRAGIGMLQYGPTTVSTADMIRRATALVRMSRAARTPLIIAGRVDVALAVGADGVHLGADDMPVACARRLMGPAAIIGVCAPRPEQARIAQHDGATYVSVGAIYPSPGDPNATVVGVEAMARVRAATALPICAVGGIGPSNLSAVIQGGADLVAVMSAIHERPDPAGAARELVRLAASIPRPPRPAP